MKLAYPNVEVNFNLKKMYDIEKWTSSLKHIYELINNGFSEEDAINKITTNWDKFEKNNFIDWIRYYQQGSHMKYKLAQYYIPKGSDTHDPNGVQEGYPGYFLPLSKKSEIPENNTPTIDYEEQNRKMLEKTRSDLSKRLFSLEKLIVSNQGANLLKGEVSEALKILNDLKSVLFKYRTAGLQKSVIQRYADISNSKGLYKTSELLLSFAEETKQQNAAPQPPENNLPLPGEQNLNPSPPAIQAPGSPTDQSLSSSLPAPPSEENKNEESNVNKFIENVSSADDDEVELLSTAQLIPNSNPQQPNLNQPIQQPKIQSPEKINPQVNLQQDVEAPAEKAEGFDGLIDAAFSNIKVEDVITRLETLAKIFKNRELGRQLAIVDMMLDKLGLASFFPSLAEAMKSSLESNQYCQGRIEEILAKLRGVVQQDDSVAEVPDLLKEQQNLDPSVQKIKDRLQEQDQKEKDRKRARKEQQNAQEDANLISNKPELEVELPEEQPLEQVVNQQPKQNVKPNLQPNPNLNNQIV